MIVVLGFCTKDQDLALRNVKWWNELGGCKGHELLVCYDPRCSPEIVEAIRVETSKCFDKIWRINKVAEMDDWPQGANYFFKLCCTWLQDKQQWPYFLWMEPDAIPVSPGWVDTLEAEYRRGKKPFMGDRVEVQIEGKDVPLHMSGVGVYENPIYLHAGEAYRAHDIAWDMAAKDQIVPNAHFTDLIEHAWKHPSFTSHSELATQMGPRTVVFHSSKDGSLIDLLQGIERGGKHPARSSILLPQAPKDGKNPVALSASPTFDIFIRTYPGDYQWLEYCLQSIGKFVTGFRKIWIVSPDKPEIGPRSESWLNLKRWGDFVEWKVMNDETTDGYLAQQITKLYADVITDYQADYIMHVDSDVIFTRPTTPGDFFENGKMTWYYTPYSMIRTPWKPVTEKFMQVEVKNEFMRRLPMMIPRWLYPKLRQNCYQNHRMPICDYVKSQGMREFSEFNALGAFAYIHHRDEFNWVDTTTATMPEPFARQFHSWSGLTPEVKTEIETILGVREQHQVDAQIKVLPNDIWVLHGDQISQWVEQEGRLDHDQNLLPTILAHIKPGSTVVDAGAFIGDHTVAYSKAVGEDGSVYAYEPNPMAFECLEHNTKELRNVFLANHGLTDDGFEVLNLSGNNGNYGGCYIGDHMPIGEVLLETLDHDKLWLNKVDLIKIDVEGYELKVLQGAEDIINRCQPVMVIEINQVALERQGTTPDQIFGWLTQHLYGWRIIEENALRNDPLYNIIALPAVDPPGLAEPHAPERIDVSASMLTPSPQASLTLDGLKEYIRNLKAFSDQSLKHKAAVSQQLVYAKLRPPNLYAYRQRKRAAKKRKSERAMGLSTTQEATS